jgi:hypothetical protein
MDFTLSPALVSKVLAIVLSFVPIVATYLVTSTDMKTWQKAAVAFIISLLLAAGQTYAGVGFSTNFWENLFILFGSAQAVYYTFFKALNLEKLFFPVEALASVVTQQAKEQIADITPTTAKNVLNPNSAANVTTAVKVTA